MNRNIFAFLVILFITSNSYSQQTISSVDLVKIAGRYMKSVDKSEQSLLSIFHNSPLEKVAAFVDESAKLDNQIIEMRFLSRPDSSTLKLFYVIKMIYFNQINEHPLDNIKLADSLMNENIIILQQLQEYYKSLFLSVKNNNRKFDYSNANWNLHKMGFLNDKEKALFYSVFIDLIAIQLYRYSVSQRGPNYEEMEKYLSLFPLINGKEYYEFNLYNWADEEFIIYGNLQSMKEFYFPIIFNVLISHLEMMNFLSYNKEKIKYLISNSILSQERYFKYCNDKDRLNTLIKSD